MDWFQKIALLWAFGGILSLGGCVPKCCRPEMYNLNQTNLCESVQAAFDSSSVASGEFCDEAWWEFFQDSQLNQLIATSLACHPTLKIAEAQIRLACHEAMLSRSALFPHVSAFADVKKQRLSRFGTEFIAGKPTIFTETTIGLASSIYELDIWQKNHSLYYSALDEMKAMEADFEQAKLILSTSIAAVYFDLQMNLAQLEVTKERIRAREELNALLQQQFDKGMISEYRLYETDTQVQLLKDFAKQIETQAEIDRNAIAALVGNLDCACALGAKLDAAPSARFEGPFPLPSMLPLDLLARRPDITAQKWLIEASCYDVVAARANFYPSIDLLGLIGLQSIFIEDFFRGKAILGLANGLGLLPLFTAGKLRAEFGIAQENLDIAIETYNQMILDAVEQVSDALTQLTMADERDQSLVAAIQDARDLFNLTNQKFEKGITNKIPVLNAIENVLGLEDLRIQVLLARYEAAVELIRAIGGGYYDCGCI